MKILLADEDRDFVEVASFALQRYGFSVLAAHSHADALLCWRRDQPAVVLAHADLPRGGGFDLCRRIRQASQTPLVLLTDRSSENDVVRAFQLGADDVVTKPVSYRVLASRLQAILARVQPSVPFVPAGVLRFGPLELHQECHELVGPRGRAHLTPIEYRLLHRLASNPGHVVSAARLADDSWPDGDGEPGMLKIHVSRLRKKLAALDSAVHLEAVHSLGYALRIHQAPAQPAPAHLVAAVA